MISFKQQFKQLETNLLQGELLHHSKNLIYPLIRIKIIDVNYKKKIEMKSKKLPPRKIKCKKKKIK